MTLYLNEFISTIRLCESTEEARCFIADEQAEMRTHIRECEPEVRPRIIAKLIFLNILGENVSYGQMDTLTLMSSDRFSYKRIGYIAAGTLLDTSSELTVLLTHTLIKDLQSPDPKIQCLALDLVANVGSVEMCQSAVTEVQRLIDTSNAAVMKRAAMAACRIVDKLPETTESFRPSIQKLMKHGAHGVVIAAINLMEHMIKAMPELITPYQRYQPSFTKILRQLTQMKPSREFQFTNMNDPFLQLRIMKILAVLQVPSDELDDALELIATGVNVHRNTGRSLLFQAVETIVATAKKESLRGLAFSQIGKLFKSKEANFLYSALSVFSRVLYSGREIVDRTGSDAIALQRYKTFVVQCLSHKDVSIRRRALDVVSALIDENNVCDLVPEVLDYVKLADKDFRVELVSKIYTAVQRFSPSESWTFTTVLRMIIENGNSIGSDIITSFCKMILHSPRVQSQAVTALNEAIISNSSNQTLVQVAAWVVGEFMMQTSDVYETLKKIMLMPQTTNQTKGYVITSMSKLAVRFGMKEDAIEFFKTLLKSNALDIQQRAGELVTLLQTGICNEVLAPLDAPEDAQQPVTATLVGTEASTVDSLLDFGDATPVSKPVDRIADDDDLLLIMQDGPVDQRKKEMTALRDLIDAIPDADPILLDVTKVEKTPEIKPFPGSVEALRKQDYIMYFEVRKNPQNPKQMAIRVSVFNLSTTPFTNFSIKFGVPMGWMVQAQAASANVLEPIGGKPVVQQLMVGTQSDVPLRMKTQISYHYGSQPITETGEINPIFD